MPKPEKKGYPLPFPGFLHTILTYEAVHNFFATRGGSMRKIAACLMVVVAGLLVMGSGIDAGEKKDKEVTLKGAIVCGKCTLKETDKCSNVLQVKVKDKTVSYYLKDKGKKEKYHSCAPDSEKEATVTGVVTTVKGKKYITPTKVEVKKAE
jgi:hypothetical protein